MSDLERILPLWRVLEAAGTEYVLATLVTVEGSNYRKPGATMLLGQDGRRAGTVSGGCLEAEVARRAFWLTAGGPVLERYSTIDDGGERPYGSGCGGVIFALLERRQTAGPLLAALEAAFRERTPLAVATILEGAEIGQRAFAGLGERSLGEWRSMGGPGVLHEAHPEGCSALQELAGQALELRTSLEQRVQLGRAEVRAWADYRPARPGLAIFGAGDDAQPMLRLARELGWFVAVADGRSQLTTRERFPAADLVRVLPIEALPGAWELLDPRPCDAAVVMTHSFDQDARILAALLRAERTVEPAYIGVLGPLRRTRELLAEAAGLLHLPATTERIDGWMARVHAPMGLNLGGETPAAIALSVVAEIQQLRTAASARPIARGQRRSPSLAAAKG